MTLSRPLRIGIVGAGAIGTALATGLALAGQSVAVVARGARRDTILREGLRSRDNGESRVAYPAVVEMRGLSDRDLVIVATKATALPDLLPQLVSVLDPGALVMPAVNGVPWWYFGGEGPLSGTVLRSVDPTGEMQRLLAPHRLVGCVVYSRASMDDRGEVDILGQQRLKIGRVSSGPPLDAVAAQLAQAGIVVSVEDNIRREVWGKLVRNASTNLVSGLTGATLEQIGQDGELLEIVRAIASEVIGLSERMGCAAQVELETVAEEIRSAGPFATSMLQDIKAGRTPELDALAAAPLEIAGLVDHEMPVLRQVSALLRSRIRCCAGGLDPTL